jgi:hypothetical protein
MPCHGRWAEGTLQGCRWRSAELVHSLVGTQINWYKEIWLDLIDSRQCNLTQLTWGDLAQLNWLEELGLDSIGRRSWNLTCLAQGVSERKVESRWVFCNFYWLTEALEIREEHHKDEVAKLWLDSLVVVEGEEKSMWELGKVRSTGVGTMGSMRIYSLRDRTQFEGQITRWTDGWGISIQISFCQCLTFSWKKLTTSPSNSPQSHSSFSKKGLLELSFLG